MFCFSFVLLLCITERGPVCSYREASVEVIEVMSRFAVVERASIDEAYMDLTSAVQERLKDASAKRVEQHLLKTTYIQGFPLDQSEDQNSTGHADLDKGRHRMSTHKCFCCFCILSFPSHTLTCVPRGAAVQRGAAVAGGSAGGPELCGGAAGCGGADRGGHESGCGGTHRVPLFGRNITQQGGV